MLPREGRMLLMTYDYSRISKIKCFLFDMDGTINLGNELIPGMEGFFLSLIHI